MYIKTVRKIYSIGNATRLICYSECFDINFTYIKLDTWSIAVKQAVINL